MSSKSLQPELGASRAVGKRGVRQGASMGLGERIKRRAMVLRVFLLALAAALTLVIPATLLFVGYERSMGRLTVLLALFVGHPLCIDCLATKAAATPAEVDAIVARLSQDLHLHRRGGERCRACGNIGPTISIDRPTAPNDWFP